MIASGIVIHWESAEEYIQLDLGSPSGATIITTTREWWQAERRFVQYNTSSRLRRLKTGTIEVVLTYEHDKNRHIRRDDACWGTSTILIEPNAKKGYATWKDADYADHDGICSWRRIANGLFKEARRESYSKLQRQQDMFRAALLTFEQCCSITGERTIQALEAAHIISSKNRGAEVVENGLLLRADLHRLYDSGNFAVDPSGRVTPQEIARGA